MKYSKEQIASAEKTLREVLKPRDTVHTILRHYSRSGMSRSISPIINNQDYSWAVSRVLGNTFDQKNGGVKMGGCGMDMGFELVYNLSYVLFKGGFGCIGKGCPSNDHSNGDRDYSPNGGIYHGMAQEAENRTHRHNDGGYALKHQWL
jgi:hypothetical protein